MTTILNRSTLPCDLCGNEPHAGHALSVWVDGYEGDVCLVCILAALGVPEPEPVSQECTPWGKFE